MQLVLIALRVVVALVLVPASAAQDRAPSEHPAHGAAPAQTQAQLPEIAAAEAAWQREDWESAAANYLAANKKGVNSAILHFRAGYALHMLKRYDEALPHHLKAAQITHPALRIDAIYNAACAYALIGKSDEALRFIQYAIDAGFKDMKQIGADTDLDTIRSDARFTKLVESIGKVSRLHEQLDFLLGTWTSTDSAGQLKQSRMFVRPLAESQAIVFTSTNPVRGRWTGLLAPHHADRTWTWTEVDAIGTRMELTGAANESTGMQFVGRQVSVVGPGIHIRLTFIPQPDGSVMERAEVSEDGRAWRTHQQETLRKSEAAPK